MMVACLWWLSMEAGTWRRTGLSPEKISELETSVGGVNFSMLLLTEEVREHWASQMNMLVVLPLGYSLV